MYLRFIPFDSSSSLIFLLFDVVWFLDPWVEGYSAGCCQSMASRRGWPRPPPLRALQEDQPSGSARHQVQLITVFRCSFALWLGVTASAASGRAIRRRWPCAGAVSTEAAQPGAYAPGGAMGTEVSPAVRHCSFQPSGVAGLHQRRSGGDLCHPGQMIHTHIRHIHICSLKLFTNHPQNRPQENGHFVEDSGSARFVPKTVV